MGGPSQQPLLFNRLNLQPQILSRGSVPPVVTNHAISKSHQFFFLNSAEIYTNSLSLPPLPSLRSSSSSAPNCPLAKPLFFNLTASLIHSTRKRIQNANLNLSLPTPNERSFFPVPQPLPSTPVTLDYTLAPMLVYSSVFYICSSFHLKFRPPPVPIGLPGQLLFILQNPFLSFFSQC